MMRQPFKIDPVRTGLHQQGLAAAGTAANQHGRFLHLLNGDLYRRLTQRLITAADQRIINACRFQPRLHDMRALPAPGAAEITLGLRKAGGAPGLKALVARLAAHQSMAERKRGLRPLAFITGAHGGAFVVVH